MLLKILLVAVILFAAICIYGGLYYFGYTNKVKKRGI